MARKDKFHDHVKEALIKDGWTITHDPYLVKVGSPTFKIDLGAEKVLAAEKGNLKIAVEIKSFIKLSFFTAFYEAIGKFLSYDEALEIREPERKLYLAVPQSTFETNFEEPIVQSVARKQNLRLIIYNPDEKTIVKWIN